MAPDPCLALAAMHHRVPAMLSLDLQRSLGREIVQKCAAFDFRLNDVAVHSVVEIGVTAKQLRAGVHRRVPLTYLEYKPVVHYGKCHWYQQPPPGNSTSNLLPGESAREYHARPVP